MDCRIELSVLRAGGAKGRDCLIIDEGFHTRGIIDDIERHAVPLDVLTLRTGSLDRFAQQIFRKALYDVLIKQQDDGGVEQGAIIEGFGELWKGRLVGYAQELKQAELAERRVLDKLLLPRLKLSEAGGSKRGLQRLMRSELVRDIRVTQTMIRVWRDLRGFVHMVSYDRSDDPIRSGRVRVETSKDNGGDGNKFLVWRGIARITDQFQVPALLLNVEHEKEIVEAFIPQIESPAIVEVALPEATKVIRSARRADIENKARKPGPQKAKL